MTEKYEHSPDLEAQHMDGAPLNRTNTAITLSNEQYERLFFQPSAPRAGDAAKRFANPSLLGLLGFLIPFTSTVLSLCQFQGAVPPYTLIGLTADYYFFGCIAMIIAGLAEFVLGNTFPFAVFIIYGSHWGSLAYNQDPLHGISSAFEAEGGATGAVYQSSQTFHNLTMCIVSFIILIGTLRVNVLFVGLFTSLVFLFALIAAADATVPDVVAGKAELSHVLLLLKVAGGFGFVGMCCGWYLAIIEVCETVQIPCPLPVFDLGTKIFPAPKQKKSA